MVDIEALSFHFSLQERCVSSLFHISGCLNLNPREDIQKLSGLGCGQPTLGGPA